MRKHLIPRLTALFLALCLLMAPALAAAKVSEKDALKTAQKQVSGDVKLTDSDWDEEDNEYEFEFRSKDKKTQYDVTVSSKTGKVRKVEKEKKGVAKAKKYAVSKKAAEKAVTDTFKGAKITKTKKETEDGSKIYCITFKTSSYKGKAHVHGKTGKIIEWEKKFNS